MNIDLTAQFVAVDPAATEADFERFVEAILDALSNVGRDDIEVVAALARQELTFSLYGDDEPSVDRFLGDVRTVLHAANCGTSGWEQHASAQLSAEPELVTA